MTVFLKENFEEFQELVTDIESVVILGKGPTYSKYNSSLNPPNTFIIGINDVVTDCYCDMIVANDKETFERIPTESLDQVPYICLGAVLNAKRCNLPPDRFNSPGHPMSCHWDDVLHKYNHSYDNKHVIPYHIGRFNKNYDHVINLPSGITSSNNAFDLVNLFMPGVSHVSFYGVGILDNNRYSEPFKGLPNCNERSYNNGRINKIRNHIESTCRDDLTIKFN